MSEISGSDRFMQAGELEVTEVPDGAMVYQKDRERVHYLNPTAVIVFELCGMGKTTDEIVTFVADSFSLKEPPVAEVTACIESLLNEKLVSKGVYAKSDNVG